MCIDEEKKQFYICTHLLNSQEQEQVSSWYNQIVCQN